MKNIKTSEFVSKIYDFKKDEILTDKITIIDFYATWCNPCKMMDKILSDIELDMKDINFYKVDAEEEYELTEYFKIKNLPTLVIITKDEIFIETGLINKKNLTSKIENIKNITELV